MKKVEPQIEGSWKDLLADEFNKPYFSSLRNTLIEERKKNLVYPPGAMIFAAFNLTPVENVRVVILGQDPYHGAGQANGLCFSVSDGIAKPPSLVNIFKELNSDLGLPIATSGNLEKWAMQGVLLLNAALTVRANNPLSHQKIGWELFTDAVIGHLSNYRSGLVFLLWGKFAQSKEGLINSEKHHILKAPHPSPFSASYGFFGCKHFSRTNQLLASMGFSEIDWSIG